MSRWHRESCSDPVIVIEQRVPNCKSCNSSPNLEALISSQSSKNLSPSSIPPDEPYGQLDLWWPPAVPYQPALLEARMQKVEEPASSDRRHVPEDNHKPGGNSSSHVYISQLRNDEFRLLLLTSVADVDDPVHVDLETHNDERYPDYETVSYTWGGEEEDSTPCQPIYVGQHWDILMQTRNCWDILMQTRNCWDMLRCLRPRRDARRVWVDAICIDQRNFGERELQVAKMASVFEKATRTIVYLGPDLASSTSTSTPYSRRNHIQELFAVSKHVRLSEVFPGCPVGLTSEGLLKREYFQRLWVIQELLVSRDVTFLIGDIEFTTIRRLGDPPSLEQPPYASLASQLVPWLKHATQKVIGDSSNELLAAVDLAHYSKATDPRDKIYGVFGMTRKEKDIVPSYSISFQHVAIGYFAYCITVKRDIRVISKAAGLNAAKSMPSWAPSLLPGTMRNACVIPRLGTEQEKTMYDSVDFSAAYAIHHQPPTETYKESNFHCPPPENWRDFKKWSPLRPSHTCSKVLCGHEALWLSKYLESKSFSVSQPVLPENYWHSKLKVDRSTGALTDVKAFHLLSFDNLSLTPDEIHRNGKIHTYVFKADESFLIIHADRKCFDTSSDLSQTHLLALYDGGWQPGQAWNTFKSRICIMRSTSTQDTFRLVSASVDVCFHRPYPPAHHYELFSDPKLHQDSWYDLRHQTRTKLVGGANAPALLPMLTQESLRHTTLTEGQTGQASRLGRVECLPVEAFDTTLASLLGRLRRDIDGLSWMDFLHRGNPESCLLRWLGFAFPGVRDPDDFIRVLYSVFVVERGDKGAVSSFFDTYFETVKSFKPHVFEATWLLSYSPWASPRWSERRKNWRGVQDKTMIQLCFRGRKDISRLQHIVSFMEEPWLWHHLVYPEDHPDVFIISWGRSIAEIYTEEIEGYEYHYKDPNLFVYIRDEDAENEGFSVKPLIKFVHRTLPNNLEQYLRRADLKDEDKAIWIAIDLQTLILWAQTHPVMGMFGVLTPYCRGGESELSLLLRNPLPKDEIVIIPKWPKHIVDEFGIDKTARMRKISIV